jgi:primosomal replication protein N
VNHESSVVEAGRQRQVRLETEIVAFGEVAAKLAQAEIGRALRLTGFIDRKGANQIEMHVTEFGIV